MSKLFVDSIEPKTTGGVVNVDNKINDVIETFYYHSGDIAEGNGAVLDSNWTRLTSNGTANKNGGMSASSGIWTFPSTGIWLCTINMYIYMSSAAVAGGVVLRYSSDGGSSHTDVQRMLQSFYAGNAHANICLPWTFNITNTSTQKISYKIHGSNITVGGGSSEGGSKLQFIKLCPSIGG